MKRIGYIEGERISFADDHLLRFGTGKDITIGWDGASLNILPLTDNIGAVRIGNGVRDIDLVIYLGETWSHVLFDNSEQRVYFEAARARFTGSTRLEFMDENCTIFAAAASIMQIAAAIQVYFNSPLNTFAGVLRMDGSQRIQFQDANLAIFAAAPSIMEILAATQVHINSPLITIADAGVIRMPGAAPIQFASDAATIFAGAVGKLTIRATSGDYDAIHINGNVRFMDGTIDMDFLPGADPTNVNQLWNNGGVLTVSAG